MLLASCTETPPPSSEPPPSWVYRPANPAWQLGELKGRFGRGQAPQLARAVGITGANKPLRAATPWPVPSRGQEPALAVVYGLEGTEPAIELINVDTGAQLWRHGTACVEPVIGVTTTTILCGGAKGVRGVGLDGKPRWQTEEPLVAITGARIVVGKDREVIVLGADDGKELARVALPAGIERTAIAASCDGELYAYTSDQLQRIADIKGKPGIAWQVPFVPIERPIAAPVLPGRFPPRPPAPPPRPSTLIIDQLECGESIVVATRPIDKPQIAPAPRALTLRAIARASGKLTGTVERVRGWWPTIDRSQLEVSAASMVTRWPRDLSAPIEGLALPFVGELLDSRGSRRLVRATPLSAAVLELDSVRAYVPLASARAVLGKDAIVGSTIGGGLVRIAIPPRPERAARIPPRRAGVALSGELRDLPAVAELPADRVIEKVDTGKHAVAAIALDPREPAAVYAIAVEAAFSTEPTAIARADLAAKTWTWQRSDGCGPGRPIGLALATGVVACAARGRDATVRATTRDGVASWERTLDTIDAIDGGGSALLAFDADRLTVLDTETGAILGHLISPDGARMRAAAIAVPIPSAPTDVTTWLVTFERGRLVARLPAISMIAVWSLAVDGVVASIAPSGDGALVTLDDGDAYRIELATAAVTPLPGLGLTWRAAGELVTGETVGGPIPGVPGPVPARLPARPGFGRPPALSDRNPEAPDLWVPIPSPPPLGDSWQYTLYERAGAVRVRNDYALAAPILPSAIRGPTGSPLVIASGAAQRDVLVIDPRTGDPLRRVVLPTSGLVFGTIVDGEPVAGTVLAGPLRIVLF